MKAELRARMREVRAGMTDDDRSRAGEAVAERVLGLPLLAAPTTVCCYVSVRRELPTAPLLARLRAAGHTVAVPRVMDRESMEVRQLVEPLVRGVLDIPTSDGPVVEPSVVLCPGLAFDVHGTRLGYGAGHYDRWLSAHPTARAIGLCFDEALLPEVPRDAHDRRMALVVTPTRVVTGRTPTRVVAAVWRRDGKVFAARRPPGKQHAGLWELPGGKVEPGERDEDALARELSEELGVRVTVGAHVYTAATAHIDLAAYEVESGDAPTPTEHDAVQWVEPSQIGALAWAPADVPIVARLR